MTRFIQSGRYFEGKYHFQIVCLFYHDNYSTYSQTIDITGKIETDIPGILKLFPISMRGCLCQPTGSVIGSVVFQQKNSSPPPKLSPTQYIHAAQRRLKFYSSVSHDIKTYISVYISIKVCR